MGFLTSLLGQSTVQAVGAGVLSGVVPLELDMASAVHQADLLMLEAKAMGKNRSTTRAGFDISLEPRTQRPTP